MKCENIKKLLLGGYLDNELREREALAVKEHLKECRVCREYEQTLKKAAFEPFETPEELVPPERVWQSIKEDIEGKRSGGFQERVRDRLRDIFFMPRPVFAGALVTVIILIVIVSVVRFEVGLSPAGSYIDEQVTFMSDLGANGEEPEDWSYGGISTIFDEDFV
jgi:predicted anti-sigma-YlaC factor YlaD